MRSMRCEHVARRNAGPLVIVVDRDRTRARETDPVAEVPAVCGKEHFASRDFVSR
jgi:hypothetical protein